MTISWTAYDGEGRVEEATQKQMDLFLSIAQVGDVLECVKQIKDFSFAVGEQFKIIQKDRNKVVIKCIKSRRMERGDIRHLSKACSGFCIISSSSPDDAYLDNL